MWSSVVDEVHCVAAVCADQSQSGGEGEGGHERTVIIVIEVVVDGDDVGNG